MNKLKIKNINNGFCRVEYTYWAAGAIYCYCLQDEGDRHGGVKLYKCSDDFEPSHEVKFKVPVYFERPAITDELTARINAWIDLNSQGETALDKIKKL